MKRNKTRNSHRIVAGTGILLMLGVTLVNSAETTERLDAVASDPSKYGWMVGSPPPADRTLRFEDGSYFRFPAMRWSVAHFRQLMPTVNVSRGLGAPRPLPRAEDDGIDQLSFVPTGATEPMTWEQSLSANYTDGIVVLHRGHMIYERYFGALAEDGQHAAMSVTKSVIGTLGAMLVHEGRLEADKRVAEYVPEMGASAFGDATVRQVSIGRPAKSSVRNTPILQPRYGSTRRSGNRCRNEKTIPCAVPITSPANRREAGTLRRGLPIQDRQHRRARLDYCRLEGKSVAAVSSERIWRKLGAEQDAYLTVDSIGTPLRGEIEHRPTRSRTFRRTLRNDGMFNGQQIVPKWLSKISAPAVIKKLSPKPHMSAQGWSYRNMWWVTHNEHGASTAWGVDGRASISIQEQRW